MYILHNLGEYRILEVREDETMRRRYFHKDGSERVAFRRKANTKILMAVVYGELKIFNKPHAQQFHFEYMQANRGALSRGERGADDQRILDNMLEYVETI